MSLINDALKRAAQKPAPIASASEAAAGMRPAEARPRAFPVLSLVIVLIPLIALGVWFLAKGLQMDDHLQPSPVEVVTARVSDPEVVESPRPVLQAVVAPPSNQPVTVVPAVAPPQPIYKLQGIYWRPVRPSAVINGKTLYIGDRVGVARVTAVDQQGVTLDVNGETKVLLLP
jgi:hypothetical protein